MVILAGDIYDNANPGAKAEMLFYDTLKQLSKNGERIILVVAGNHDSPERLVAAWPLAMEHGIIMAGTPKTVITPGRYGQAQVMESGEGYVKIKIGEETAVVLLVPYPSEKRLNEILYEDMSDEEANKKSYGDRIHSLFTELSKHFLEDTINLIVSHLFVMGSEEAGSERSIQLGGSYLVSSDVFPEEAQYIALGHVHKPQIVPGTRHRARYSGSPIPYSKNELNFDKKLLSITVEAGKEAVIKEIPLTNYKPIEVWKCSSLSQALERCERNSERECYVYLEIETKEYIREDDIKRLKDLKKDILQIRPILETEEGKVISDERREKSFSELFQDFYRHENGVEVSEETIQTLLEIIQEGETII